MNFSEAVKSSVIATNCDISAITPKEFTFREVEFPKDGKFTNRTTKNVGNATTDTNVTFEFGLASDAKLPKRETIPIQLQIHYTRLNGLVCKKIITCQRAVTQDRNMAEKAVDIRVISANLAQFSAKLAQTGDYESALLNANRVKLLVERANRTEEYQQLYEIFMNEFQEIASDLQDAMGVASSGEERKARRTDHTAKKLYNYKSAKAQACSIQ